MQTEYILTYVGQDKPGLVDWLAGALKGCGVNWMESQMANLGGTFCGVIRVSVPNIALDNVRALVEDTRSADVWLQLTLASPKVPKPRRTLDLMVTGADRTGIVSEISAALSSLQINMEELSTRVESAPMSGEPMFVATAALSVPQDTALDTVRTQLERLSDDLMVELNELP